MSSRNDKSQVKRELRLQIARQRRRIDRQIRSLGQEAVKLVSWQTYVGRFPALTLTAVGAALTGLSSMRRGRWPQELSLRLCRRLGGLVVRRLWAMLRSRPQEKPATDTSPGPSPSERDSGGDDHAS